MISAPASASRQQGFERSLRPVLIPSLFLSVEKDSYNTYDPADNRTRLIGICCSAAGRA